MEVIRTICDVYKPACGTLKFFKLTTGEEGSRFNNNFQIPTMFIGGKPVLHLVDEATNFSAAPFLRNISAADI